MPDANLQEALEAETALGAEIRARSERARTKGTEATNAVAVRNEWMRQGYADGWTYYRLAQASGLSIKQVQRICDLSRKGEA